MVPAIIETWIKCDPDGTWRLRVYVNGKPYEEFEGFESKLAAQQASDDLRQMLGGREVPKA